jgi:hypothetical protein
MLGVYTESWAFSIDLCIYFDAGRIHRVLGVFYSIYAFLFYAGCVYSALGRFKLYWAFFVAGRHLQCGFSFLGVFAFLFTLWAIIEGNCVHSRLYYILCKFLQTQNVCFLSIPGLCLMRFKTRNLVYKKTKASSQNLRSNPSAMRSIRSVLVHLDNLDCVVCSLHLSQLLKRTCKT